MKISISGVRGIFGNDLGPKDILRFTTNFSSLIKSGKCVIGSDTRPTGKIIMNYVTAALMQCGIEVYNLGIVPTPVVFKEARKYGSGIIITSSHNPLEWNGLKFILEGRGINEKELEIISNDQKRSVSTIGNESFVESDYISESTKIIGDVKGNPKVTIDVGGGAAKNFAKTLLERIGCEVNTINENLLTSSRGPDPTVETLDDLIKNTKDIGFAYDLDSDRVVIVKDGKKKSPDITLSMGVVKSMQLGYKKFVLSIDSSMGIEKYIKKNGGTVWRSRVGEANVIQTILEKNADAGGEGSSGGFILPEHNFCRDGLLTSGLIATMLDQDFSEHLNYFEQYKQSREKISFPAKFHDKIIEKLESKLHDKYQIESLDGIKLKIDENSWALIRKSNTEDIIRISIESNDESKITNLQNNIIELLNESYEEIK
ncbi:MAG: phosphomannomutase [Candidatus Nitrosopelagicus sp.]|nr:phosphomannomutase [Candidatus Nitrosopelagicus sp.]